MSSMEREIKFVVDPGRVNAVRAALESACRPDPEHADSIVATLYFDTPELRLWDEKRNSDYLKTKLRIRWYEKEGRPLEPAFLERKERTGTKRQKWRIAVVPSASELAATTLEDPALVTLAAALAVEAGLPAVLLPTVLLRYRRRRFVETHSGLRVALDSELRIGAANRLLLPAPRVRNLGLTIVELKGDSSRAPSLIARLTSLGARRASVSKYAAALDGLTGASAFQATG